MDENYFNSTGSIVNGSLVKCFSVKAIFLNNGGIYCFVQIAVAKYSSLKLDFGKWHFYEIKDSFAEVLLLKMYSVYLPFSLGFYHYKMSFLESVLFENLFESLF